MFQKHMKSMKYIFPPPDVHQPVPLPAVEHPVDGAVLRHLAQLAAGAPGLHGDHAAAAPGAHPRPHLPEHPPPHRHHPAEDRPPGRGQERAGERPDRQAHQGLAINDIILHSQSFTLKYQFI